MAAFEQVRIMKINIITVFGINITLPDGSTLRITVEFKCA
jgi:hypothetical protein